jgi:hypothetical protein
MAMREFATLLNAVAPETVESSSSTTPIDWASVHIEFRAGVLSVRELGRKYRVSHTAIAKQAKAHGWKRDLTEAVRRRVSTAVATVNAPGNRRSDHEIVEEWATAVTEVVKLHRRDIAEGRALVSVMLTQLRRALGKGDTSALPSHAACMRDLSTALTKLVALERQAYNVDPRAQPDDGTVEALVAQFEAARASGLLAEPIDGAAERLPPEVVDAT